MSDALYKHFTTDIKLGCERLEAIASVDRVAAILLVSDILAEAEKRMDAKPFIHGLGASL